MISFPTQENPVDNTFIVDIVVMYGNAVWFLRLSRGIGSCILYLILGAPQYTMLIFKFPSLCTLRQYIRRRHDYCIQSIYPFIITICSIITIPCIDT